MALRDLEKAHDIIIRPSDKGGNVVLLDEDYYVNEILNQLHDTNTYSLIKGNPFPGLVDRLNDKLYWAKEENLLTNKVFDFLRIHDYTIPVLYTIPKIHKDPTAPPGRPIVSGNGGPLEDPPDPRGIYQHRSSVARKVCERNGLTNASAPLNGNVTAQLYVEPSHRFIYCEVPKAGCSNWKRVILLLNNPWKLSFSDLKHYQVHNSPLRTLSSYPPDKQEELLANYTKVMFTRDPLQRVVSAYRDKFLHHDDVKYSRTVAQRIREKLGIDVNSTDNITFQQFIRFIVEEDPQERDIHWKPMYQLCDPCNVHYDVIGSFDTLKRDADYVLRTIGAPEDMTYPNLKHHSEDGRTNHNITRQYLDMLPPDLLGKLLNLYSIDFSMFEYEEYGHL
ncbi:carbohydrate sulfotransferase 9-like [Gastrophryne carolinensis]